MQSLCSLDVVSLVARRLTSLHATAACAVDFDPDDYRQSAGLVAYYDNMDYHFLRVCRDEEDGKRLLILTRLDNGKRRDIPCAELPEKVRIYLRLDVKERELLFSWSLDARAEASLDLADWKQAGPVWDTSELSDEYCSFGEFTGTFVGIACVDATRREKYVDFDWFEYRAPT
jgi:xylan 1,4-beta-xylosidase